MKRMGFAENNDLRQDVLNAFVQFQPFHTTSLQAEVRSSKTRHGDLLLRFDPDAFFPQEREEEDVDSLRVGVRHSLTNRSELLGSVIYQEADLFFTPVPEIALETEGESHKVEVQHLYQGDQWHLTSGASYQKGDDDEVLNLAIPVPFPPFLIEDTVVDDIETDYISAYVYGWLKVREPLTVIVGASADALHGRTGDKDRVNPKFGLIWEPIVRHDRAGSGVQDITEALHIKTECATQLGAHASRGIQSVFFRCRRRAGLALRGGSRSADHDRRECGYRVFQARHEGSTGHCCAGRGDARSRYGRRLGTSLRILDSIQRAHFSAGFIPIQRFTDYRRTRIPRRGHHEAENARDFRYPATYLHSSGLKGEITATYVDQKGNFIDTGSGAISPGSDDFSGRWMRPLAIDLPNRPRTDHANCPTTCLMRRSSFRTPTRRIPPHFSGALARLLSFTVASSGPCRQLFRGRRPDHPRKFGFDLFGNQNEVIKPGQQ